ncbi:DUF6044 family protein [Paenibacillus thermotolerans]|uniref:DUF6044 family protein n=1 Tax=Paenibacillus thermotolerans TaxID=3027807 RepID=UPI002368BE22|nr:MULTISPECIES: DUF6044 family protein [unclassified Paenibacillus]
MNVHSVEKRAIWMAVVVTAAYVSPLFLLGEDAHIRVHDILDSNIAWYKVLTRSGQWFGPYHAVIPQIMNGLNRNAFGTEFSGIVLLHALFPSMTAYALSQTLSRAFAFIGMYMLLKDHFVKEPSLCYIRVGVALCFALTPFWPSGMLSTLGHPLALWAMLHVRNRTDSWIHWITLFLLPFYSSLVLGFFFFLAAVCILWIWDVLSKRRWNWRFLASIVFMTAIYLLTEYRLLLSLVLTDEPTSRNEFVSSRLDLWHTVRLMIKNFVLGHNHVMTLHTVVILPATIIVLYLCLGCKSWRNDKFSRIFLFLFALNALLSVWYAFWFHEAWQPLKERFGLLNTFNFARFHFLRPLVIYLGFAVACMLLWRNGGRKGRILAQAAVVGQIAVLLLYNDEIVYRIKDAPSFRQFYAVEQFAEIDAYIGRPKQSYRIASIGLHPAVSQYNGFYTLDSYNNFYSLQYKHEFRKIIANELAKNKKLRIYFDTWGGRCYVFVSELGKKYDYRRDSKKQIRKLSLNTDVFKRMGGTYLLSSVPIANADENGLIFRKSFVHPHSAWKIFLYEVK